jgi:hypothetical protein
LRLLVLALVFGACGGGGGGDDDGDGGIRRAFAVSGGSAEATA